MFILYVFCFVFQFLFFFTKDKNTILQIISPAMMIRLFCFIDLLTGKDCQCVLIIHSLFGHYRSKKVKLLASVCEHPSRTFRNSFVC